MKDSILKLLRSIVGFTLLPSSLRCTRKILGAQQSERRGFLNSEVFPTQCRQPFLGASGCSEPFGKAVLNKIRAESLGECPKSTVDGEIGAEDLLALKGRDHVRTR